MQDRHEKSTESSVVNSRSERTRKLAAIMFTDMVGYSALTQKNESLALDLLEEHRQILRPLFPKHGGTEVETAGDAFFVEFNSALEAVNCAIEIQNILFNRNANLESDQHIVLRIGLHVGDVVHVDSHLHGDGVNIAARIEPLAKPGGICISEDVVRQIHNKIDFPLQKLPTATLKNIKSQVEVYCVVLPWQEKSESDRKPILSKSKKQQIFKYLGVTFVITVVFLLLWIFMPARSNIENRNRIAVLPLANISEKSTEEYFSDGMTEELISQLAKISGLSVIARTSVLKYKDTEMNIREIGEELNVGTILSGSVRIAADKARITVQLVDVNSQQNIWTDKFDRKLNDIFAIQSEIALNIANELKIQLVSSEKQQIKKMGTENAGAYKSYLLGKFYLNKKNQKSILKGLDYFQDAINQDSEYALAHVGIADCYALIGGAGYSSLPQDSLIFKAMNSVNNALHIDASLAEAYNTLAYINFRLEWDWDNAEKNYKKAIELKPGYAQAYERYAFFLALFRRFDEAIPLMMHAEELDPLSLSVGTSLGRIYHFSHQYKQAITQFNKILEINPDYTEAVFGRGLSYLESQMYDEAISELKRAITLSNSRKIIVAALGFAYATSGNKKEAQIILDNLNNQQSLDPNAYFYTAVVNGALGNADKSIESLYRAYEEHFGLFVYLQVEPLLAPFRSEPEYDDLVKKLENDD